MRHFFRAAALVLLPWLACAQVPPPTPAPAATVGTVAIPDKVKVEGVPPIPQSIADDLSRYAEFRSAQLVAWNSARRQVVILTRLGSVPQLYLVDVPNKAPTPITSDKDNITSSVWAQFDPADPNTLVFRRDAAVGSEAFNLYKYDVATGTTTLLTDGKSRYSAPPITNGPVWASKGRWIAYDSTERNGKDRDLWIMQPSDPKTAKCLIDAGGIWLPQDWSPEDLTVIAEQVVQSGAETYLWRVDVKSGARKALTPAGEQSYWGTAQFSPDGKSIYAISTRGSGTSRIWRAPAGGGPWLPMTPENEPVSEYAISPDGLIAVVFDRGSTDELQVIDPGTQKPRRLPPMPAGLIANLAWRPDSRELGFSLQNSRSPGDVYSIDTSLATLTRWTTSPVGAFNPETLPEPEIVTWKGSDGLQLSGVLYRPASKFTGPRPIVVNFHGGPQLRWRPIFAGRSNYLLNELGVAVLFPNFRGSDGFGAAFAAADDGKKREAALQDVGSMLDWIARRPDFDKDRIMLTGGSYGGYLALESAVMYNDRIRGVFELAGQTNLVTFLETTQASRQDDRRKEYGDERDADMRAFLLSISPVTSASALKKPVGIVQPAADTRVIVGQAQELIDAVKKNNVPVWYVEYEGVGHDNFPGTRQNDMFNWAVWIQFVRMYLVN